ncbi:fungal-specific transcription factor domain-containing protein [Lentinula raphanica]|nr:fungal-specific transcription factor domain-containing protein [Lentinula raphanica]KAJ3821247.1 fungal-specific transcription factor domain-containing protein [Lentinula raphanica]
MPADSSHNPQVRRISRKQASEDDIDVRRARGEVSCAECRRLKLKCDKKLPCSSCVRRGVHSICPNGKMAAGQGTRFVLADTSQLHTKITEMGQRIRQLEDALAISHSGLSNEQHPLLRDELLSIKFGPENGTASQASPSRDNSVESIDAFGTLTIFDRDVSKYFGRSAGSETLLLAGAEMEPSWTPFDDQPSTALLTQDILKLSTLFPMCAEANLEKTMDVLFSHLPERPRAWALCETYLEQASWQFQPIRRDELIDDILAPIYRSRKDRASPDWNQPHTITPHRLATLYIVFAIGALVDLTLEPYSSEAENFALLCRAAISLRSVFDSPEICTVQTIALLAHYHAFAGKRYTLDNAWTIMSLAAKLAQSVGLHRDGSRWDFDAKTVDRRRALFYELFCSEQFHSLAIGRPPALRPSYVDCEFPTDESMLDEEGNPQMGYFHWKYEFCRDILSQVLELTLTAEPPSYQTILDLDRKIREKTLPPHLNVFLSAEDEHCTPAEYMRRCNLGQYRSVTLLFLHRSFFAQAMLDHPVNPLRSPYAPSFLAAYRCASGVIKSSLNHYDRFPDLCRRWWSVGSQLFSAAIIVGSIVTRSPSSAMAPNAFIELGLACDLFEKCTSDSRRSRSGMAILNRLRDKAFQIFSQLRSGAPQISTSLSVGRDYGDDELALFGGQTRVLFSKLLLLQRDKEKSLAESSVSNPVSPSNTDSPATSDASDSKDTPPENLPDVHPSLVEYISLLPPSQHPRSSASSESSFDQFYNSNPFVQTNFPDPQLQNLYISSPEGFPQVSNPNGQGYPRFFSELGNLSMETFTAEPAAINGNSNAVDLMNLDLMVTDSGIDQQWRSFMRDSGLLDHSLGS